MHFESVNLSITGERKLYFPGSGDAGELGSGEKEVGRSRFYNWPFQNWLLINELFLRCRNTHIIGHGAHRSLRGPIGIVSFFSGRWLEPNHWSFWLVNIQGSGVYQRWDYPTEGKDKVFLTSVVTFKCFPPPSWCWSCINLCSLNHFE